MTNITPDLEHLRCPIDQLQPLTKNPRRGKVEVVARSYARFGQRKPIVVRRTSAEGEDPAGIVIAGNHQLLAAKKLGWTHIAAVWTDDDDVTARAFAITDNRASEVGETDSDALLENLELIMDFDESLLESTGYTTDDLDKLLAEGDPGGGEDASSKLDGALSFRLIIDCSDEMEQAEIMAKLEEADVTYQVQVL